MLGDGDKVLSNSAHRLKNRTCQSRDSRAYTGWAKLSDTTLHFCL